MASSSFGWRLTSVQAYGNPNVQITPAQGAGTTGGFTIGSSTPQLQAGVPIFVEAIYSATVPNVNPNAFPSGNGGGGGSGGGSGGSGGGSTSGGTSIPVATYSAVWSEVPATAGAAPVVNFNNAVGNTFTGYNPSATPNVTVTGDSGTFIKVSQPGTIQLKLTVTLQAVDGSTRDKDYFVTLNIGPAPGA
jgi:hypothetical protein